LGRKKKGGNGKYKKEIGQKLPTGTQTLLIKQTHIQNEKKIPKYSLTPHNPIPPNGLLSWMEMN
jgi:hypothetical protein